MLPALFLSLLFAQGGEPYSLRTARGVEAVTLHRISVPENRDRPDGPRITLAVARLPAEGAATRPPVVYLAGGPGQSGIAAAQVEDTYDVLRRIRRTADVLLLDQRGTGQSVPRLSCAAAQSPAADLFESARAMERALEPGLRACLHLWRGRGVDLAAYNTESSADDVAAVAKALNIPRVSLLGFSYGTHLAVSVVRRHPALVDRVVFAGYEGPDDSEKYPAVYDRQIEKIAALAATDPAVASVMPDFTASLKEALARAERTPFEIALPPGGAHPSLRVGREGLLYLLRRDVGDTNDLPVFPKMIWQLLRSEPAILAQYALRRYQQLSSGVSLMSLAMDCASGASARRRADIAAQMHGSIFGPMTNPLPGLCDAVGVPRLPDAYRAPLVTGVPALFVSGTLDSNTPPEQAERARPGFTHSAHVIVTGAGHESTLIPKVAGAIAAFLRGDEVKSRTVAGPPLRFQPLR